MVWVREQRQAAGTGGRAVPPAGGAWCGRRPGGSAGARLVDVEAAVDAVRDDLLPGLGCQAPAVEPDLDLVGLERHHVADPADLLVGVRVRPGGTTRVADVVVVA